MMLYVSRNKACFKRRGESRRLCSFGRAVKQNLLRLRLFFFHLYHQVVKQLAVFERLEIVLSQDGVKAHRNILLVIRKELAVQ